jgi:hypothetical protein
VSAEAFTIRLVVEERVLVCDIWPEDDGPEDPTVDDVRRVLEACGPPLRVADDWCLTVSDWEVTS